MHLTATEYSDWYEKALKTFASSQTLAWQEHIYKIRKNYSHTRGKLLFLLCYALSTWEHNDAATNYLTEEQVMSIINKINSDS